MRDNLQRAEGITSAISWHPKKKGKRPSLASRIIKGYPTSVKVAGFILAFLIICAIGADVVKPLDTRAVELTASLQPPSLEHPMGTDRLGRDMLAHSLHGLRISFSISTAAAFVAISIGGVLGLLAGTLGGWADTLVMRAIDIFQSQNHFLFSVLIVVMFRPILGPAIAVMLSVALTHWVSIARIVRGELLRLRNQPFILAAVGSGSNHWHLIYRHLLPHLLPSVVLAFILLVPHAIFHESGLSFLGLGLPPHQASLGNLLAQSQEALLIGGWWLAFFPGLLIFLTCLAVGILGEYWRDRHHPRWRSELEL